MIDDAILRMLYRDGWVPSLASLPWAPNKEKGTLESSESEINL
jgi:hypothetical protein